MHELCGYKGRLLYVKIAEKEGGDMCYVGLILLSLTVTGVVGQWSQGVEVVKVENQTSGAVGITSLNLTCDFTAVQMRYLGIVKQSVSWKKIQNGQEIPIYTKQLGTSSRQQNESFHGDWSQRGITLVSNYGPDFHANIQLPAGLLKASDGAIYQCDLEDDMNKHYTAKTLAVVYHGPGDNISIHDDGTHFQVVEGQNLTLYCEARCIPTCNYTWLFGSKQLVSEEGIYNIPSSNRKDAGNYTCLAQNAIGNGKKVVDVEVFYGAGHNVWFEPPHLYQNVTEHNTYQVTCLANCHPACSISWHKGDNQYVPSINGTVTMMNVSRTDSDIYTCHAINTVTNETRKMELNVQYAPGTSAVISPVDHVTVEDDSVNFTCRADCNPECNFSWSKNGRVIAVNRVLSLASVSRLQAGTYKCRVRNTIGVVELQAFLFVRYPPDITYLMINQGDTTVEEGSMVTFKCSVDSNPLPRITWTNFETNTIVKQEDKSRDSVYVIKDVSCLDAARFQCAADNDIGNPAKKQIQLYVTCTPRADNRALIPQKVFVERGAEGILPVTIIAYPPPSFTWYRPVGFGTKKIAGPRYHVNSNVTSSTLTVSQVVLSDYGNYSVSVANPFGNFTWNYQLLRADSPDKPDLFYCTRHSESSLELHWVSQDNNGAVQEFQIKYTTPSGEKVNLTAGVVDPGKGENVYANITDLTPYTMYKFFLSSSNRFGQSDHVITTCITSVKNKHVTVLHHPLTFLQGIGSGVGICVFLIVVGLVVGYLIRRRYARYRGLLHSDFLLNTQ